MPPSLLSPSDDRAFPVWRPGGVPVGQIALGRTIAELTSELGINQAPSGSNREIPLIQRPQVRQARAEGHSEVIEEKGQYGTDLYTQFMSPYEVKK